VLVGVQALAMGSRHTCALMATGGVRCWGSNGEGQLGDGTTTDRLTPPPSDVLDSVQAIAAGAAHTCALMQSSGVRCWGRNIENENDVTSLLTPPDHDLLTSVQAITAGAVQALPFQYSQAPCQPAPAARPRLKLISENFQGRPK